MGNIITLTTDFGWGEYVATMKGVILSIALEARIIDINHSIRPQNILEGAYIMYSSAPYFQNAIHVGVVDPGVGTERAGLIVQCENGILVGPDNGLLIPCARTLGLKKIYKITNEDFFLDTVSDTFHGRDIFAPVAAHLSKGIETEKIGDVVDEFVDLKLEYYIEHDNTIEGKIMFIDNFGNIITSIPKEIIRKYMDFEDELEIELDDGDTKIYRMMRFQRSYAFGEKQKLLATISSNGFFEISLNQGSAQELFKAQVSSKIRVVF